MGRHFVHARINSQNTEQCESQTSQDEKERITLINSSVYTFPIFHTHTVCLYFSHFSHSHCHNEDGRIQLRKESLLQEVIHSEKLNGAFRRAEAELPYAEAELFVGRCGAFRRAEAGSAGKQWAAKVRRSESRKQQGSGIAEPERTVNVDRKHCKDLTKERA